MKNNVVRMVIYIMAVIGYGCIFYGVKQMSASVTVTFIFCWTAFVLGTLFIFSPEIKRLIFKKDRLELERYKHKVDKALVEYDEFKETIYPLLEIILGEISNVRALNIGANPEILMDFTSRVEAIADKQSQKELKPLIEAAKSAVLHAFGVKLNIITSGSVPTDVYIGTGLTTYEKKYHVEPEKIFIDEEGLRKVGENINDLAKKRLFMNTLNELMEYYNTTFN
ncbi:hypothetical protein [Limosilactobacillus fastidiosus]|uniref:Uncharacterized protein n=1 Tax=Limosilactobacillus fastidiosus TaxID=2759855 RepID=A0A7W3U0G5_9LACO|nr:hypothetical protein [Limosilactobacillus fastidiosus]MBB1086390.1 hypothetical protein [Limosilactobacillus fastidiosus]MCD7086235.1 hypothetical protein [Limosilactobacillus fastidiosus]MCD7114998.1 hypothetical protein [Limosilactobacillus fastidiosus]MCD7116839.1 hypothetical protein [Limosilactobacillus fastidiosus]